MAYTQAELNSLERAIVDLATGASWAKYVVDGDVVEKMPRDLPQMRALRLEMIADIADNDPESNTLSALIVLGAGGKGL